MPKSKAKQKKIKYPKIEKDMEKAKAKEINTHLQHKGLLFSNFAKNISEIVGNPIAFFFAVLLVIIWIITGPLFHYSDTWQLVINTGTTIITFLIVFLIQHTQNRDTIILNLKIDELIKGHRGSQNTIIDLTSLSDDELKELEEAYKKLVNKKTGK